MGQVGSSVDLNWPLSHHWGLRAAAQSDGLSWDKWSVLIMADALILQESSPVFFIQKWWQGSKQVRDCRRLQGPRGLRLTDATF